MSEPSVDVGTTISIRKSELDALLAKLWQMGYEVVGPQVKDHTVIHAPLKTASELPVGYSSQQEPGKFRLVKTTNQDYFDVTVGPHSWKQYFFPPKSELMRFHKSNENQTWSVQGDTPEPPRFALVGVRPCDLAAIQVQDLVFMREEWCDPVYRDRRTNAFIVAVNCLEPCGTCFCASMGTGPKAESGFDLCMTELEDSFLVEIGSEAGRMALRDETISWRPASAFLLQTAQKKLDAAREKMRRELPNPEALASQLLDNLDHTQWDVIAKRCLSCTSCTQVCPTCFCWDTFDSTLLPGDTIVRERVWDSCFNPDYSYVFGGNTRPNTRARYRQWLTHKFASWYDQFGVSGCVGCGRCITWCPAGIDHVSEIATIRGADIREGERS
jgi:sulfhydrogenase subunit beta (sulfur reductase)